MATSTIQAKTVRSKSGLNLRVISKYHSTCELVGPVSNRYHVSYSWQLLHQQLAHQDSVSVGSQVRVLYVCTRPLGFQQTAFLSHFCVCGSHSLVTYYTMECALVGIAFCGILLLIGLGLGQLSFPQDVLPASLTGFLSKMGSIAPSKREFGHSCGHNQHPEGLRY